MKRNFLSPAASLLLAKATLLSVDSRNAIEGKRMKFVGIELYKAEKMASGITEIFGTNPEDKQVGVTNIDKGRVPYDMVADSLRLEVALNTTAATPQEANFANIFDADGIAPAVANGEIEILADGAVVIPSIPVSDFFAQGGTGFADAKGSRVVKLQQMKLLVKNQRLEARFRTAEGVVLDATNNNHIRLTIGGTAIVS